MKGITTRDIEHYNPRCNARGVIKAGTKVHALDVQQTRWVVTHHADAPHMSRWDWAHSYVNVPTDVVQVLP